ncbi:MAG: imidazoleglycerol-phosphate dehydratase [bacterium]|nr:imidazoleglycerol-phosphate dehydratase [bacterium]
MSRTAKISGGSHSFPISIALDIDGSGKSGIATGVGFFDHLLQLFAKHGSFNIDISCSPDIEVDDHHLVDEVGLALGTAFTKALHDTGINSLNRYGFFVLPMDESLTTCAVDFCGRSSFTFDVHFKREKLGELSTEMVREFWDMFSQRALINLVVKSEFGYNDHHIAEGLFKCVAKSIQAALTIKEK